MAAPKKVVDSWKAKSWYKIVSPKFLGETEVAEVPAADDEHLINRILAIPLKEITRDISHMYTTIRLRVDRITGKTAYTKLIGHSIAREYLSTLVRRRRDALRIVFPTKSKDGVEFTVKALVVTANDCSGRQKKALHRAAEKELTKKIGENEFGAFIQSVVYNKANAELHGKLKKIAPIKRVEIYKTELKEVFDVPEVIELERQKKEREAQAPKAEEAAIPSQAQAEPAAAAA